MADPFDKKLEDWEKKAKEFFELGQVESTELEGLYQEMNQPVALRPSPILADVFEAAPWTRTAAQWLVRTSPVWSWQSAQVKADIKVRLIQTETRLETNDFYYRLYNEVPYVIAGGKSITVDDILANLIAPETISEDELSQIINTISEMISAITAGREPLPEMAEDAELPELPGLDIPKEFVPSIKSISAITTEEIIKALSAPVVPKGTLTDAEWKSVLYESGQVENEGDVLSLEEQAEQLVRSWQERNNSIAAFKAGVADMPDFGFIDLLKEAVIQPGLALADIAGTYFEHVSMPLAGLAYRHWFPDVEAEFQRLKKTENMWVAAGMAWEHLETDGAGEWITKYMVLEAIVDPLTYVGWGIFTRILGRVPLVGARMAAINKGMAHLFELPFDVVKNMAAKMPKTIGQRAMVSQHIAGQTAEKYLTRRTGKLFSQITMDDWQKASDAAIKFYRKHPQSETEVAQFAREILKHKPVDENLVKSWANSLGSNFSPEDFTRNTIESVDSLFEDMFMLKVLPPKAAASKLIGILGGESTDDMLKVAQRLMNTHGSRITREAGVFGRAGNVNKAMQALMKRNYRYHVIAEEGAAFLARTEKGRYGVLLHDIPLDIQRVWSNYVDKIIIKPFAQAYLTFGMYGPMNVFEDYFRSVLGGVFPRRMTVESWEKISWGLTVDPELRRYGLSELIGPLAREGSEEGWNNWVLQLAMLGQKGWSEKLYTGLVRLPGAFGMDVRRNFMGNRFMQILAEKGGAAAESLAHAGPKVPRLADRKLVKQLEAEVYRMKMTGNPDLVRGAKDTFTRQNIVKQEVRNILMRHPEMPTSAREFILKQYTDNILFSEGGRTVDKTIGEAGSMIVDEFLKGPEYAAKQFEDLAKVLTELEVRNPEEMAQLIRSVNFMSETLGATPKQIMAQATIKSRGLPFAQRRAMLDSSYADISAFMDRAGASIDGVVERIKGQLATAGVSPEYIATGNQLLDVLTTRRIYTTEFRAQNIATRQEIFAGVTAADLKTGGFWDDFYRQMDNEYAIFDQRMAELDGMMVQAIKGLDRASGITITRPPMIVKDRPIAPQDVATLMGVRGDDISRAILDVQVAQSSKVHFVEYVLAHTEPTDIGFTRESIGQVYDQIALSLNVKPETLSWMTQKQLELEATRRELHELWNAKLLPDEEIAQIGKYVDETADAVQDLMFEPVRIGKVPTPEVIHVTRARVLAQEAILKQEGYQGFGRYSKLKGASEAAKGLGVPVEDVRLIESRGVFDLWYKGEAKAVVPTIPPTGKPKLKQEFTDYDKLRQSSMDEAQMWYQKEYPDYSNANAFDAMMKAVYPYWTYESQRWFWLPRSFIRHPVTFTELGRWQNNSDYGYIHIPGTSADINPFRGTIYGTLTTRLTRRDYPEYYDQLPFAGGYVEFMDFLSRYGFYPGAHMGIPLALMGGREAQLGEILPATYKTGLDAMIATFPESEAIAAISKGIFNDRFREYLTIKEVDKRGGNGSLTFSKMQANEELTPEERSIWNAAKSEVSWYSAGFEQFGVFRMRTGEQNEMYKNASIAIEEITGYTPDQQDWLRKHGYRLWDMVGGMSPTEQQILQELDYYRWVGSVRPLLPGRQQEILNRIELDWDDVKQYTEKVAQEKMQLQREFLSGQRGPRDYNDMLIGLYIKQREYIDQKVEENPLMDLDNRKDYYKEYNIPQPVLHPMSELLNLYFNIELEEVIEPETGEKVRDWDKFWAMRDAVELAIPDNLKQEWKDYLSRNSTRIEELRREVYQDYLRPYNEVWQAVLDTYSPEEQKLIEEYLYLEKTGQQLDRQDEIKAIVRPNGRQLVSNFRSDTTINRQALRFANPHLDAWLFYWGRISTFQTEEARKIYEQIAKDTGRRI